MQTLSPSEFQRIKDSCICGVQSSFSDQRIRSFAGRYCNNAECLAILYLLHGVKNCGCHVQYFAGRIEVDSFMTWKNNLVVECKDEETCAEMFEATKLAFSAASCGWKVGNSFGLGFAANTENESCVKLIADLIIYFHSIKSDFKKNIRVVK